LSFVVGDSGYWYVGAYNTQPIDVDIDAVNYTFRFSSSKFQSSVVIDGETRAADVSLDLLGKFVNIAHLVSLTDETGRYAECEDAVNNAAINVIAKAFNPPGTLQPGNFTWYRDYGLPTQVTWDQGHAPLFKREHWGMDRTTSPSSIRRSTRETKKDQSRRAGHNSPEVHHRSSRCSTGICKAARPPCNSRPWKT
jgi:hypothetical protein